MFQHEIASSINMMDLIHGKTCNTFHIYNENLQTNRILFINVTRTSSSKSNDSMNYFNI